MNRGLRLGSATLNTNTLQAAILKSGPYEGKIAGLYDLEETLGRGHFAVVKLARHVFTGEKVAVKVIDKSKLDEVSKAHLFQEVRCMKLVQHPNVVRLYEVIDTATKLYLILELGDGGDLYDYIMRHDTGLSEQLAKEYFRQIVRAISYCHQLHVVHRDLKPENVVFFEKLGVVKLTDFGFSNKFCPGQKLETSCGSLAYSAPEILLGDSYDAPAVDVWSLGVILYMLVCGQAPFQEANDSETLTMIMDCKYSVPAHVSRDCQTLIARMLVRNPEKRAGLSEIANHQWLEIGKHEAQPIDSLPLVSREHLCEEDHNLIVQKMVNGSIATKEEVQDCLDKNEYNHITATYFLLAERKLRSKRPDIAIKIKRPEQLTVPHNSPAPKRENNGTNPTPCLLSVPRTPGDVSQRSRKCSIVQEDEEEEDISVCSGRDELIPPLNRRGSRSEGRLNLALQERLETVRKPITIEKFDVKPPPPPSNNNEPVKPTKWRPAKTATKPPIEKPTTTTIITDSSTISIPISALTPTIQSPPKYKTMPAPARPNHAASVPTSPLNEIFEEGGDAEVRCRFANRPNRATYEQRRSKFHKTRTASCSSSDASDDDSEKRKKRANKLETPAKPFQGRRDSHDDSSDSQEPGAATSSNRGKLAETNAGASGVSVANSQSNQPKGQASGGEDKNGRKNANLMMGRRHKASRRRNGETRLRESQSLNRITEVQEDGVAAPSCAQPVSQAAAATSGKSRGIGARILQGLTLQRREDRSGQQHQSRKECQSAKVVGRVDEEKEEKVVGLKKMRLLGLGKYFQVHKKLFSPGLLFGGRSRLYKAQSCGSLMRDKINLGDKNNGVVLRQRAVSVMRDMNQNEGKAGERRSSGSIGAPSTVVQLNNVCNELTGICAVHLGQASKCCSFC